MLMAPPGAPLRQSASGSWFAALSYVRPVPARLDRVKRMELFPPPSLPVVMLHLPSLAVTQEPVPLQAPLQVPETVTPARGLCAEPCATRVTRAFQWWPL